MEYSRPQFPEPVPTGTQLVVLPFLAAVEGLITSCAEGDAVRVTMHRIMAREQHRYIQQICEYLGQGFDRSLQSAGRLFPQQTGLMGKAIEDQKVFRTKPYESLDTLKNDLKADLTDTGSSKSVEQSAVSFLSVPFVGADGQTVLVLYVDSYRFNHFADDTLVENTINMCRGFCRMLDWLTEDKPLENLRNFLTPEKDFKPGKPTAFDRLQFSFPSEVPKFKSLRSFNFEMTSV
ncbi:MAG: hypothetical protein ACFB03_03185 [Paracoccaceae bacterium]